MRYRWTLQIGVLTLVIMIACAIAGFYVYTFFGSSLKSEEFPLSEKWNTKLQGDIEQITIVEDRIIIARTMTEIYALDTQSGNILWRQSLAKHFSFRPVLAHKGMLFLTDGKGLLALNQLDGKIIWEQDLQHPSGIEVMDANQDLVAVNSPPYIKVYHTVDGALLWKKPVCRERTQTYFFNNNIIVPCFGLTAIDILSGEIVWETKSDNGFDRIWKSAFSDGVIYFSQDLENITAFDLKNRRQLWKTPLKNDRSQAFSIDSDYLFVSKDDQLCVLNRSDGKIIWCADGLIKAKTPTMYGDVLYLFNGLQNGITAYDMHDGSQIGRLYFPAYNFITVDNEQLMTSSDEFLVFSSGKQIYAYGK